MTRVFAVLVTLLALTTRGEAQSLVGSWKVTYPAGMRMMNGEATVTMATGSLTLESRSDSLVGDLVTEPSGGSPTRPPAHLAGKVKSGEAILTSRSKATMSINGSQEEVVAVSTWVLHAKGDSLVGTVERKLEGHEMGNQAPSPVTGTRVKR